MGMTSVAALQCVCGRGGRGDGGQRKGGRQSPDPAETVC